ncbi:LOW QUALITY PROTEIN: uncharacterized protein VK521_017370 [Ammospiza maritima maritima]
MEKENRFKLFMPPRLSAGQVSAGRSQMNELFSKLYKESEKIKQWKLTVETELNQKERKLQENRKITEAQKKAIQELQIENEKLHLKLEDEICENKDLLEEAAASRHLCNLLKETCTRFTKAQLQTSQNKIADLMEAKLHNEEMLKESQVSKEHLRAELEEAKISLQKAEVPLAYSFTVEILKKQVENKTKCIEELQKVLKKKIIAESKKSNTYEEKVNKLHRKKQKVLVPDTQSDSSEHTDLLSIVSEEEMFKNLYKDYPQASQLHSTAPKKSPAPCSVKSPGSALKLKTMRRMHEAGCALQNGQEKEN